MRGPNAGGSSLAASVSRGQAACICAAVLATLCAFLAGMLGVGSVVHVYFTQGDRTTALEVLSWSVFKVIRACLDGQVYALGVICLVFSVVLPYVKVCAVAA